MTAAVSGVLALVLLAVVLYSLGGLVCLVVDAVGAAVLNFWRWLWSSMK